MYLIWSWSHSQWWGANGWGYTDDVAAAGRYSAADAGEIHVRNGMGSNTAVSEDLAQGTLVGLSAAQIGQELDLLRRL